MLRFDHAAAHERREEYLEPADLKQPLAVRWVGVRRKVEQAESAGARIVLLTHTTDHEFEPLTVSEARLVRRDQHGRTETRKQVLNALLLVLPPRRALNMYMYLATEIDLALRT